MLRDIAVGDRPLAREELIKEVRAFLRRASVEEAILYGSYARGDARAWSDVDLIVISPGFEEEPFLDRLPVLYDAWDILRPYPELLAYTPEEFEEARHRLGIERIAHREGIRISAADDADGAT